MAAIPTIPVTAIQDNPLAPVSVNESLSTRALQQKLAGIGVGSQVQDSLTPTSTTLAPSVRATNEGLALKSDTGHAHTVANVTGLQSQLDTKSGIGHTHVASQITDLAGGTTGQVLKKNSANPHDFSWQDDLGGVGGTLASQAEAEAGVENTKFMSALRVAQAIVARVGAALLTGYTVGANAALAAGDTILQAFGKIQGQINALISGKADLLNAVTESGTAWTLTKAAHSNRLVIANSIGVTGVITVTFDTAGMDTSDGGRIAHGNTGQVTITGATFGYAPGVSATPNIPAGLRGWLDWRFDGTTIVIEAKSEDASGGGGFAQDQRQSAFVAAAASAGTEETLATLNFAALTVGQRIHITGLWSAASWANTNCTLAICAVNIGGARVAQALLFATSGTIGTAGYTGHRTVGIDAWFTVRALTGADALIGSALGSTGADANLNPPHSAAANTNAAFTATITVQRQGANDLAVGLEHARITIE